MGFFRNAAEIAVGFTLGLARGTVDPVGALRDAFQPEPESPRSRFAQSMLVICRNEGIHVVDADAESCVMTAWPAGMEYNLAFTPDGVLAAVSRYTYARPPRQLPAFVDGMNARLREVTMRLTRRSRDGRYQTCLACRLEDGDIEPGRFGERVNWLAEAMRTVDNETDRLGI